MPLLLIPLAFLILMALWAVLLPLSIWQRYRIGRSRRLARPWLVNFNAWSMLVVAGLFVIVNALLGAWFPHQFVQAMGGILVGLLVAIAALWTSRFEWQSQGLYYQPNPWIILGLTALVVGRVVLSVFQIAKQGSAWWNGQPLESDWHAGVVALAGLLLGYALGYAWGLRHRLRRLRRI